MKQHKLKITVKALSDMEAIYDYIANQLQAPDAAMKQYDRIAEQIEKLRTFPERCKLLDALPEHEMGIRQLSIDRYLAFYVADEDTVTVLRVLYSASDITERLRGGR